MFTQFISLCTFHVRCTCHYVQCTCHSSHPSTDHFDDAHCSKNKSYYQKQWCSVPRCLPSPTPAKIKKLIPGVDGLYTLMFSPLFLSSVFRRQIRRPEYIRTQRTRCRKLPKEHSFFQENKSQSRHGQQYTMWHVVCLKRCAWVGV